MAPSPPTARRRLDVLSLLGAPIGLGLILAGQAIEGGSVRTLLQLPAALVVLGGTFGAVLLSFGTADVRAAFRSLRTAYVDALEPAQMVIARVLAYSTRARRTGVLSLEPDLDSEPDAFLRRALSLAVDGATPTEIRNNLEVEMDARAEEEEVPSRVFEAAGGYAPTIGILGAVIGLIHVMEHLADPSRLGSGIAVAFVATIYGVGSANLLFLPIASRLRQRAEAAARRREMLIDAAIAIQEGVNPRVIEQRLSGFMLPRAKQAPAVARPTLKQRMS
jgi:chemotaxis protein MotA